MAYISPQGERQKKAKISLKSAKDKYQSIASLFLIIVIILALLLAAGFYWGILGVKEKQIIFETAYAQRLDPSRDRVLRIPDCFNSITEHAGKYGADRLLAERIIKAESGGNERAENKSSTATGCFQFINGTWRKMGKELWGDEFYNKNIYNPDHNVELGLYVLGKYGSGAWAASGF
jgi:soluble lytic murein transglycosylase-like protein